MNFSLHWLTVLRYQLFFIFVKNLFEIESPYFTDVESSSLYWATPNSQQCIYTDLGLKITSINIFLSIVVSIRACRKTHRLGPGFDSPRERSIFISFLAERRCDSYADCVSIGRHITWGFGGWWLVSITSHLLHLPWAKLFAMFNGRERFECSKPPLFLPNSDEFGEWQWWILIIFEVERIQFTFLGN